MAGNHAFLSGRWNQVGAVGGFVLIIVLSLVGHNPDGAEAMVFISLTVTASTIIVANLLTTPVKPLERLLRSRPLVWIGRRSYGLYLWHLPIYFIIESRPWTSRDSADGALVAGFLFTFLVAGISFRIVEMPFLRLKDTFTRVQNFAIADSKPST
jgi:peptidoglycan/LPS O-acetylase OafA/YrhL